MPISVGASTARVVAADGDVSRPLTGLRGTHVSGGASSGSSATRRVTAHGFRPLGMEIVAVGTSSDADHIISPSKGRPQPSARRSRSRRRPADVATWDMHATATPGDHRRSSPCAASSRDAFFTARKGTFGHGMGVSGGWELTAQYLG